MEPIHVFVQKRYDSTANMQTSAGTSQAFEIYAYFMVIALCMYVCIFTETTVALSVALQWCHNGVMASQITSLMIVYSTVYTGADQSKHQSSASLAFVQGIHRWPVNSPHKGPLTQKMFPFDSSWFSMLMTLCFSTNASAATILTNSQLCLKEFPAV